MGWLAVIPISFLRLGHWEVPTKGLGSGGLTPGTRPGSPRRGVVERARRDAEGRWL